MGSFGLFLPVCLYHQVHSFWISFCRMTGISGLTVPPRSTPSTGTGSGTTTTQSTGTATTQSTTSTTSSGTGTTPTSSSTPSGAPDSQFNTLMTSMLQAMAGNRTGGPGQSPQVSNISKFKFQCVSWHNRHCSAIWILKQKIVFGVVFVKRRFQIVCSGQESPL